MTRRRPTVEPFLLPQLQLIEADPLAEHVHSHEHHLHGAGHVQAPASFGKAFAIGITLNTGFVVIEAIYGISSNSMALLADAGHNLSDVLGLFIAWGAAVLSKRAPSTRFTYGLRGTSIPAALFNAVFLLVSVGAIGWEAVTRLIQPEPVVGKTVMIVAAIGILINGVTAWLFASGRKGDLNIRGAFLHMAADAAISAGVVAAGFVLQNCAPPGVREPLLYNRRFVESRLAYRIQNWPNSRYEWTSRI
jgi:cobalt-zinc-cadmium efflux system protein